ncbi:protein-export membrane protein [Mycobacterium tuberculosis]|uniref:Protein-export membrane protein n=1 Tax=Mycobacterium tuberculosis TaxID=1773 RepID=A0A0U0STY1_MYCTX|nr:protein-export membrane protein [Mycobacterium tuberculosis]
MAGVTAAVSARLKADEARRPGFYAAGSGPLPQVRGSTLPVMELALQITLIVTSVLVVLLVLLHVQRRILLTMTGLASALRNSG